MMEIELKARVRDAAAVAERVSGFASYARDFDKSDEYWHGPDWRFVRGTKGFRLRMDGERAIVTFKQKRNDGGIEINRETEFEVSDAVAFKALVERIGCEPFYRKRKSGKAYEYDGCTIELVRVDGVGDFIEIERLVERDDPAEIALAQGSVRAILAMSGVPDGEIEGRSYSELVLAAQAPSDS
ncbi:MAG: class IV adenylate cyclase [Spirochaetes bacterium]|nr:class IV adenylate cyclase [Spirochaetota bacterium]MBU1081655.1 class IV adenylate cyclase [Spirochaetota bacterium]